MTDPHLSQLIRSVAGEKAANDLLGILQIDRAFSIESAGAVSRGAFSMALSALLFHELLRRAPTASGYVADRRRQHQRIVLDHGALGTVRLGSRTTGALPAGTGAFSRLLEPIGYHISGTYPRDGLGVTGRSFTHRDFPETLPQFFVSELQVDRFSKNFQAAADRVFGPSRDPLTLTAHAALADFAARGRCEMKLAAPALREMVAAFGRAHGSPALADYRLLRDESADCAWIASEGYVWEHAAERVEDVAMTACAQRSLGRPVVDAIETSAVGSVRQTAFKADPVRSSFRADDGSQIEVTVPGPIFGFVSRDVVIGSDGKRGLDLRFSNPGVPAALRITAAG